jgi:nickel-type superoxide dismutase maturation protease
MRRLAVRSPLIRAAVVGPSMLPTLAAGDWLVVRRLAGGHQVKAAQIVLVEHPARPGLLLVKRAVRRTQQGWWVEGDNPAASEDSRSFGAVPDPLVIGRVLARYHPSARLLRTA